MQRRQYEKERVAKDASRLVIGIVVSDFNSDFTEGMLSGALRSLHTWNVKEKNIYVLHVPGSFEVPLGCLKIIKSKKPDAIVALGCIIRGETDHNRYIAEAVSNGLMQLSLEHNLPISFGVITVNNLKQAKVRSHGKTNKGVESAIAALEMCLK